MPSSYSQLGKKNYGQVGDVTEKTMPFMASHQNGKVIECLIFWIPTSQLSEYTLLSSGFYSRYANQAIPVLDY